MSLGQLKGRLESRYGVDIEDAEVYDDDMTLRKLARKIKARAAGVDSDDEDGEGEETSPPNTGTVGAVPAPSGRKMKPKACCVVS